MFSQVFVCPRGGGGDLHAGGRGSASKAGGSVSRGRGGLHPGGGVWIRAGLHPGRGIGQTSPPNRILQDTVNEREIRILLECILVYYRNTASPLSSPKRRHRQQQQQQQHSTASSFIRSLTPSLKPRLENFKCHFRIFGRSATPSVITATTAAVTTPKTQSPSNQSPKPR